MRQVPTLHPVKGIYACSTRAAPAKLSRTWGCMQKAKRAVLQTVAQVASRVRTPPPLSDLFTLAVAQPGRAPRCDRGGDGFKSRRPTHFQTRGVSQAGLRRATLYRVSAGSNPARPAKLYGAVAERLGTGLSIQPTRVRVSSVPPSSTAPEAQQARAPAS